MKFRTMQRDFKCNGNLSKTEGRRERKERRRRCDFDLPNDHARLRVCKGPFLLTAGFKTPS